MTKIALRNRFGDTVAYATVDDDLAPILGSVPWSARRADTRTYAARANPAAPPRWTHMHRVILGLAPADPRRVDHINGDGLDNRRANLRVVTTAENAQNQGSRGGSSQFRGVAWDKSRDKWMASGQLDGRKVTIGRFVLEEEAGIAAARWRAEHMPYAEAFDET